MYRSFNKGFGVGVVLIVLTVFVVASSATLSFVSRTYEPQEDVFDFGDDAIIIPREGGDDFSVEFNGDTSLDERTDNSSQNNNKVSAGIVVHSIDQANPLNVVATCSVAESTTGTGGFIFFPGDGMQYRHDGIAKSSTFSHTYEMAGQYDISCVPIYDGETVAAHRTIERGGITEHQQEETTSPAANNSQEPTIDFSFSPVSGELPTTITTHCVADINENLTSIGVHRGGFFDIDFGKEGLSDKFFVLHTNTRGEGVPKEINSTGMLGGEEVGWEDAREVYCSVQLSDGTVISSDPIQINFN